MKISITFMLLVFIVACNSTEAIPQPKDIHIQNTIQDNLKEARQAQISYQALKNKRKKDNLTL